MAIFRCDEDDARHDEHDGSTFVVRARRFAEPPNSVAA
jgi:hypothetical protein